MPDDEVRVGRFRQNDSRDERGVGLAVRSAGGGRGHERVVVGEVPARQVRMREQPGIENPDLDLRAGRIVALREARTGVVPLRIAQVTPGIGPAGAASGVRPAAAASGVGAADATAGVRRADAASRVGPGLEAPGVGTADAATGVGRALDRAGEPVLTYKRCPAAVLLPV